jgi:hypothetical protein
MKMTWNSKVVVLSIRLLSILLEGVMAIPNPVCVDACYRLANDYKFAPCAKKTDECRCKSSVWLGTMALCVHDHCDHDLWDWVDQDICQTDGGSEPLAPLMSVVAHASQFSKPAPKNVTKMVSNPIIWDPTIYENEYLSSLYFIGNKTDSSFFGYFPSNGINVRWLLCMFALILCLIGAVQNHILPLFLHRQTIDLEGSSKQSPPNKLIANFKRYLLLPATFKISHIRRPYYLSIPTRSQSILISLYLIINLIFMTVNYHLFDGNTRFANKTLQLQRYITDRAGVLALSQIPLLIAFAGRNNVLIWLTGYHYSTFNVWHKWVARMCTAYTFIHSVVYSAYYLERGGLADLLDKYNDDYMPYGALVLPSLTKWDQADDVLGDGGVCVDVFSGNVFLQIGMV